MAFQPRPKQQEVLSYTGGMMGVAAVPGSGKTRTLSALAAKLVAGNFIEDEQEVLIVTLVNSAVDNFARQVGQFVKEAGLLPNLGYRVRTLHGLCNDIVRERPGLVGLADDFAIIDEREADSVLQGAVETWVRANPDAAEAYFDPDLDSGKRENVLRGQWGDHVLDIARAFVRQAKDEQLLPEDIRRLLDRFKKPLPLAEMGCQIYANYQRGLAYRGAVDFQDLIRLALKALQLDDDYLQRLRVRWAFVLEDEAQDSSKLQEDILRLLVGKGGNWVRVGDPNQAIYETFTTARPEHLWNFLHEPGVTARELPNSGRCARPILSLANFLIDWTRRNHPRKEIRDRAPLQPPHIEPTPPGDPQPNPPDELAKIALFGRALTPGDELQAVVDSLGRWLDEQAQKEENQRDTAAVLVPRNKRGFDVVDALKRANIDYVELLRSTTSTRETAGALGNILKYLAQPGSPLMLAIVYQVWRKVRQKQGGQEDETGADGEIVKALRKCRRVEDFLYPQLGRDWLTDDETVAALLAEDDSLRDRLETFRALARRWQDAVVLPIDQLILILAGDLFTIAADIAIAHSLAVLLRQFSDTHPYARLPEFTEELGVIARNERRFLSVGDDDRRFDPDAHKGRVTVATMHAAKGLEWDRVYLLSVNSYDFPSAILGDQYISEKWYVRDSLNLEAETLAQLQAAITRKAYHEGAATEEARLDYTSERLRLLYVGITRARKELIITWNNGRRGDQTQAIPFIALQTHWEQGET